MWDIYKIFYYIIDMYTTLNVQGIDNRSCKLIHFYAKNVTL